MSGIAVIWNRDGRPADDAVLLQMTQLMEHRGPDGAGHWRQGSVALGHRTLNTTPESLHEKQPLSDESGDLYLTFDGRLDNRDELKSLLTANGASGRRPDTDAELVVRAYRQWGQACPEHLLGDFAFAIWDGHRKQLFCARDPLGVRPLFYATVGETFVCASEIRSLFAQPGLKKEPELGIMTAHLLGRCVEFDETLYKGVSRLPMAHCLTITRDTITKRRYWDINPGYQIRYRRDEEYAEHFRNLFFDAVRLRMRSNGPIAGMLSGGLDSSSIVCATQRLRGELGTSQPDFQSFSMVFDRFRLCDERPFMNEVIRCSGATANFYVGDRDLSEAAIARHVRYPGLPYSPQAMVLTSMFEGIRARGFRVLLDGTGGDELAGPGQRHIRALMWGGKWRSLGSLVSEYAANYGVSPWKLLVGFCLRPSVPDPIRTALKWLISPFRPKPRPTFVREDALSRTGAADLIARSPVIPRFSSQVQSEMYRLIFTGWGPTVLTDSFGILVSYFGIEMRQPFRDRRLVEFALALPPDQLWRDGFSRVVLRKAMKGIVPEKVLKRRGKGQFVSLYDAVLAGSQAGEVRALFEDSALASLGLVDAQAVQNLVQQYLSGPALISTQPISDLIALELLCREILGRSTFAADSGGLSALQANRPQ